MIRREPARIEVAIRTAWHGRRLAHMLYEAGRIERHRWDSTLRYLFLQRAIFRGRLPKQASAAEALPGRLARQSREALP